MTAGAYSVVACSVSTVIEGGVDSYVGRLAQSVGACDNDVALVEVSVGQLPAGASLCITV